MNIMRMDKYQKAERRKQKQFRKRLAVMITGVFILIGSLNVSYAQLNMEDKVEQYYSFNKQQVYSYLDQYLGEELALQETLLRTEAEMDVLQMGEELERYTVEELIPQFEHSLQNHFLGLVSLIKQSKEQEKEAFLKELETSLEQARQEAEARKAESNIQVPSGNGTEQEPVAEMTKDGTVAEGESPSQDIQENEQIPPQDTTAEPTVQEVEVDPNSPQ